MTAPTVSRQVRRASAFRDAFARVSGRTPSGKVGFVPATKLGGVNTSGMLRKQRRALARDLTRRER